MIVKFCRPPPVRHVLRLRCVAFWNIFLVALCHVVAWICVALRCCILAMGTLPLAIRSFRTSGLPVAVFTYDVYGHSYARRFPSSLSQASASPFVLEGLCAFCVHLVGEAGALTRRCTGHACLRALGYRGRQAPQACVVPVPRWAIRSLKLSGCNNVGRPAVDGAAGTHHDHGAGAPTGRGTQ